MDSMNGSLLSEGIVYCTALYLAAQNGHRDVVKYISELNLAPPSEEMLRCTALYFAAQHGQLETVRAITSSLIAGKVNQNDKKILQKSEIHSLLKVDINSQDMKGNSALHYAAMEGNVDLIKKIISKGANIDSKNANYESVLHHAVQNKHANIVSLLLRNNSIVDAKDILGNAPIHYAVKNDYLDIVKLLLEYGANMSIANVDKKFPLDYLKSVDVFNVILSCSKNVDLQDSYGNNLLHIAVKRSFLNSIDNCIKKGIKVDSVNFDQNNAIHLAIEEGHTKIVKKILKHDFGLSTTRNADGYFPIHLAFKLKHYNIIELFLDSKVDINMSDGNEKTCLYLAAENNYVDLVNKLLTTGVFSIYQIVEAFDIAQKKGYVRIVELLSLSIKNVDAINICNYFKHVASWSREDLLKILLSKDENARRIDQGTMMYIIKRGHDNIVKLILKHQKDNNISYGEYALSDFLNCTHDKDKKKMILEYVV